jgi:hypothetical protein
MGWLLLACLPACTERVVGSRGILTDIPGAEGGERPEVEGESAAQSPRNAEWEAVLSPYRKEPDLAGGTKEGKKGDGLGPKEIAPLRMQRRDGSIALISNSPANVMYHLTQTLASGELELLYDQVLSEASKVEYRKRARDPREAVAWLAKRQEDIGALFAAMPLAEQTPGVSMTNIGRNRFRLSVEPDVAQGMSLRLTAMDVIIEEGHFRLLMIR